MNDKIIGCALLSIPAVGAYNRSNFDMKSFRLRDGMAYSSENRIKTYSMVNSTLPLMGYMSIKEVS